jgi:hypothetical protein
VKLGQLPFFSGRVQCNRIGDNWLVWTVDRDIEQAQKANERGPTLAARGSPSLAGVFF